MKQLEDLDPFPFGQYGPKGKDPRKMQDVPASYYHYLWTHGLKQDQQSPVGNYIVRNLAALKQEHRDGIWS
jgi:hypothetical protein